jgi:hypothetical protein
MSLKSVLVMSALAVLTLSACDNSSDNIGDELDERAAEAESKGTWRSPCLDMSLGWEVVGLDSQREDYEFTDDVRKTIKLFNEDNCTDERIEITYSGDANVGNETAEGNNMLDLNFNRVTAKILNQETVDALNSAVVPSCGINDWQLNVERDVTAQAGQANCLIGPAVSVYDIIKTGGSFIKFGVAEGDRDKSAPDRRPTRINDDLVYTRP